ncbi:NmrA family NAD(P)-binding protein [Methylobacterium nonmethylotrophicum]|uniref:NmrA family protein n=1 Tax=Methylobacterium nonmethylotrophicum TaxID=1141884 RepID=A0A4Z0NKG5_9HYPH|nr:NmrA family NAD(P)-binding protein [Methylobacterium nonmethylotrophicum]TGD96375.1 NmrA family protein [Methylobacterium nonmethylotrophicum]
MSERSEESGSGTSERVLVAGATGGLGLRIVRALAARGASVRVLVRPGTPLDRIDPLRRLGAEVVRVDLLHAATVTTACSDVACVVSALNGLADTILDAQTVLLDAAAAAGVPRFIPSDFALDFTRTAPGRNRNLDLRRDFHAHLDRAPLRATSVLNGAFMDMLTGTMPLIQFGLRRVLCFGDPDQPLDVTAMDDVAAYTGRAALDPQAPRILRIAGAVTSASDLARTASEVTGEPFTVLRLGGPGLLTPVIAAARILAPGRGQVFPVWQGLQYWRDMVEGRGKLEPLDNDRYPGLHWTGVREVLGRR